MRKHYFIGETIFSAGGVLVDKENKKILIIQKNKTSEWLLPKGRMEENETIEQTAEREVFEETGYKNKAQKLLSVQVRPDLVDPTKTKVVFWFFCLLSDPKRTENTQAINEDFSVKWVDKKEAISLLNWEEDKKLVSLCANF